MSDLANMPAARVALVDDAVAHLLDDHLAGAIATLADTWSTQGRFPHLSANELAVLARATVVMALLDRGTTTLLGELRDAVAAGVPTTTISEAAFRTASAVHSKLKRNRPDALTRMVEASSDRQGLER